MKKIVTLFFVALFAKSFAIQPASVQEALTTFDAVYNKKNVSFKWIIGHPEKINGTYTIERSSDGKHFDKVSEVKAAVNAEGEVEFMDTDCKPLKKRAFYRLKFTGETGEQSYSRVVPIEKSINAPKLKVTVSQDDAQGIEFSSFRKNEQVLVVIRDKAGNEYFSKSVVFGKKNHMLVLDNEVKLPAGEYLIIASSQSALYSNTFIVE
jgi:hypothetical protein